MKLRQNTLLFRSQLSEGKIYGKKIFSRSKNECQMTSDCLMIVYAEKAELELQLIPSPTRLNSSLS